MDDHKKAEIRNKLQSIQVVLNALLDKRKPEEHMVRIANQNLRQIINLLD